MMEDALMTNTERISRLESELNKRRFLLELEKATTANLMEENSHLARANTILKKTNENNDKLVQQYEEVLGKAVGLMGEKAQGFGNFASNVTKGTARTRIIIWIYCYMRKLPCDRGTPCRACSKVCCPYMCYFGRDSDLQADLSTIKLA